MVYIIVKKNASHQAFRPHLNRAMGPKPKYYHTKDDYLADMKKGGFQPYEPIKSKAPKEYAPSQWAKDMIQTSKNAKGKVGERFYDELAKKGVTREKLAKRAEVAKKLARKSGGGFA